MFRISTHTLICPFPCRSLILLLTLLLATQSYGDAYNDGKAAYEAGDYTTAMNIWKPIAEAGEPWAQYAIANLYMEGLGIDKNLVAAGYWLERSAVQGLAPAQYRLGNAYQEGTGFPQSDTRAIRWWRFAADQGLKEAMYNLGVHYYFGRGVELDQAKAFEWLEKAAEAGHKQAQNIVMVEQAGRAAELEEDQPAEVQDTHIVENQDTHIAENQDTHINLHADVPDPLPELQPDLLAQQQPDPVPATQVDPESVVVNSSEVADIKAPPMQTPEWIMAQDPAHFTIQMAAMSSEDGVERYLQKYALGGNVGIYLRSSGSNTMFVIVFGSYSDKVSAQQAVENLPKTVQQQQLWIRPFADIQAIIQSSP